MQVTRMKRTTCGAKALGWNTPKEAGMGGELEERGRAVGNDIREGNKEGDQTMEGSENFHFY